MNLKTSFILSIMMLAASVSTSAQGTGEPALPTQLEGLTAGTGVAVDQPLWLNDGDQGIFVLGRGWKAEFGSSARFVPFFGASAPRSFPVDFRLDRMTVGGVELPIQATSAVAGSDEVVFDRGIVDEVYRPMVDGMEQLFRIRSRPGHGDLSLDIAVTTELAGAQNEKEISFSGEFGSVRYGAVTLIDARRVATPIASHYREGRITITIPAEVLAHAAFPIVVDPIIQSFPISSTTTFPVTDVDVAYELGTDRWCAVVEFQYTAIDRDVIARTTNGNGTLPLTSTLVEATGFEYMHTRIASNRLAQNFLIVASRNFAVPGQARQIFGRTLGATTLAVGNEQQFSAQGTDNTNPDVGGDPSTVGPTYYCVIWENDYGPTHKNLYMHMVGGNGVALAGADAPLDDTLADTRFPSISTSNGEVHFSNQFWTVVWEEGTTGDHDIYGRRISWSGSMGAKFPIHTSGLDTTKPSVSSPAAGLPIRSAVTYEALSGSGVADIGVALLQGTTNLETFNNLSVLQNLSGIARSNPVIETSGCGFTILCRQTSTGPSIGNVLVAVTCVLADTNLLILPEAITVAGGASFHSNPRIASKFAVGGVDNQQMFAWTSAFIFGSSSGNAALHQVPVEQNQVVRVPMATENLGIEVYGSPSIGQTIMVSLCNAGPSAVMVVGFPAFSSYCGLPVGVDLNLSPIFVAGPFVTAAIPANPNLIGFAFAVQGADQNGTACLNYRVSDTLIVTIN